MEYKTPQDTISNTEHTSTAVYLGVAIILIALILGGLYLWGALLSMGETSQKNDAVDRSTAALSTAAERTQEDQKHDPTRSSDELKDIERDLNSISLDLAEPFREFDELVNVPPDTNDK